jgi:hypothetical protein
MLTVCREAVAARRHHPVPAPRRHVDHRARVEVVAPRRSERGEPTLCTVGGGVVIEAPWLRSTSKCQRLRVPPQLNNTVCVRARACARVFGSAGAVSSGRLS